MNIKTIVLIFTILIISSSSSLCQWPGVGTVLSMEDSLEVLNDNKISFEHLPAIEDIQVIVLGLHFGDSSTWVYITDKSKKLEAINTIVALDTSSQVNGQNSNIELIILQSKRVTQRVLLKCSGEFLDDESIVVLSGDERVVLKIDGFANKSLKMVHGTNAFERNLAEIRTKNEYLCYDVVKYFKRYVEISYIDTESRVKNVLADDFWLDIGLGLAKEYYSSNENYEDALRNIGEKGLILQTVINQDNEFGELYVHSWKEIESDIYQVIVKEERDVLRYGENFTLNSIIDSTNYLLRLLKK